MLLVWDVFWRARHWVQQLPVWSNIVFLLIFVLHDNVPCRAVPIWQLGLYHSA